MALAESRDGSTDVRAKERPATHKHHLIGDNFTS